MYLDSIMLARTLPCLAEPGKIIVIGRPSRSLQEVLPYLAALPNVIAFNPDTCTLTFRRPRGFLTLYPDKVYITQVASADEGLELLAALKDAINATWEHRDRLTAVTQRRRVPRPLDVYSLLPQTNCKQCGEATCMAFAFALLQSARKLSECPPLHSDASFAERRAALQAML
ncbi:MAG: (Fe-S)-binding protein [Anaerolineae bacterium]